jgi:uncharacterized protein (TIGR03435 family)
LGCHQAADGFAGLAASTFSNDAPACAYTIDRGAIDPLIAIPIITAVLSATRTSQGRPSTFRNSDLIRDIIAFAYEFPLDRVERRPQWMYDDRYDVAVTTPAPTTSSEQKLMLQKLLEERFGLAVHRLSNPSPVYFLVRGSKVNLTDDRS